MAVAAVAGTSAAVGMAGAMQQAAAQQAAANYNAAVKQQQATASIAQAQEDERRQRIQGKMAVGNVRNAIGASGIQTEGSALDVLENSASSAELDALTIRHQGQMKAWAYTAGANLDLFEGQNAKEAGNFAAASALLKGGSAIVAPSPSSSSSGGGKG